VLSKNGELANIIFSPLGFKLAQATLLFSSVLLIIFFTKWSPLLARLGGAGRQEDDDVLSY
jgi:hypothetical protein